MTKMAPPCGTDCIGQPAENSKSD
ncbi:hypothetical protein FOCC_FOCC007762, partial [Frankliniella occidentalis]